MQNYEIKSEQMQDHRTTCIQVCAEGTAQINGGRVNWLGGLFPLIVLVAVWWGFVHLDATLKPPDDDDENK